MVLYFTPTRTEFLIYMGRDKFENEELIKYGLPTDIWFHVDNLSSAHVYLRLPSDEMTIDDIPEDTLEECAQLVKANSIVGSKQNNISVVYTPWDNLMKKSSMDVGQVGFYHDKRVKKVKVAKKISAIVNRLTKTKREENTDLADIRNAYDREIRWRKKEEIQKQKEVEKEEKEESMRKKKEMSYEDIMNGEMTSNHDIRGMSVEEYEDDFM